MGAWRQCELGAKKALDKVGEQLQLPQDLVWCTETWGGCA